MSQENVEVARRACETLARGELGAWMGLHHPECEFMPFIVGAEGGDPYRGHAGCRAFWADIHSAFTDWRPRVEGASDLGEVALLTLRLLGRGRDSGAPIDRRVWQTFRTQDGKAVWWRIYASRDEALEAAGLSE